MIRPKNDSRGNTLPPVIVNDLEDLYDAIEDFHGSGVLRLTMSETKLFLSLYDIVRVEAAIARNQSIRTLEINEKIYTIPFTESFLQTFSKLHWLLKKIADFNGDGILELDVTPHPQASTRLYINDDGVVVMPHTWHFDAREMEAIAQALQHNHRIRIISVKDSIRMSIGEIYGFVYEFLTTYHLRELRYPIEWAKIYEPEHLLRLCHNELQREVARFNEKGRRGREAYECFAFGVFLNKLHRDKNADARRDDHVGKLGADVLKHLAPFLATKHKTLVLG